ncbi:methylase for ubiquinone menaquinone biosynthesis [Lactobacillus selangorensis]|uniref:Methylase for ubiquinone menaquinone biosynthesis n=1 Tax=Lactobacillus selangorensis TaxID=81857 RepID=A0A0R2FJW3_9LACO|nr:class I SAM-dependent methyltransferase [Lactobacillus selangorensis]KRN28929.1 methylase for ubiquinone menaquinone biosynthesis [Lactobacillus selangorensis]KRN32661.1 methylase for ubiquinone menaquinone biosynthesis [Lactobacillus selangorensis]
MAAEDAELEAMWDDFAADYDAIQSESRVGIVADVTAYLAEQHLLQNQVVLDVAGGTGRYAIPFAQVAKQVILSDISAAMLKLAAQHGRALTNITYVHQPWSALQQRTAPQADLVFAAMFPALQPTELAALTRLSRHAVVIVRAVAHTDTVMDSLVKTLDVPQNYDPSADQTLMDQYRAELTRLGQPFTTKQFQYTLHEQVTRTEIRAEVLPDLSFQRQEQLPAVLDTLFGGQTERDDEQTYTYELLKWLV